MNERENKGKEGRGQGGREERNEGKEERKKNYDVHWNIDEESVT